MISIACVTKEDLKELAALYEELVGEETNFEKMNQIFEWMQTNPHYILLGAKYNGKLVGSVMGIVCLDMVGQCNPFMVLENVIVSDAHRNMGIGRKLMEEIERIAKERECFMIEFVSSGFRKDAHKFYESVGYKLDAVKGFRKFMNGMGVQ